MATRVSTGALSTSAWRTRGRIDATIPCGSEMGGITIRGTEVNGGIDKLIWGMLPEIIRSDRQARWLAIIGLSKVLLLFVCSQSLTSDRGVIVIGLPEPPAHDRRPNMDVRAHGLTGR